MMDGQVENRPPAQTERERESKTPCMGHVYVQGNV
jgi:hypothetical protein